MLITKETIIRALRTFLQAAISYALVSLAAVDFSEDGERIKAVVFGLAVSSLAAGLAAVMNLEKGSGDMGGGEYTFDAWVKAFKGKKLNPDGVSGIQCVDLIKHYCRSVIGIPKKYSDTWGNAVNWFTDFESKPWLTENFRRIPYTKGMVILKGDIAVFRTASVYGHIAVCTGKYDSKSFEAYDQNYNGTHSGMTKRNFAYDGNRLLLGVLRAKDRSNITTPPKFSLKTYKLTNVRGIYKGWGTGSGLKKVKEITADAKKHATSKMNNANAFLYADTKVTLKEIRLLDNGNLWAKIPSGYICIWEEEKNKKYAV